MLSNHCTWGLRPPALGCYLSFLPPHPWADYYRPIVSQWQWCMVCSPASALTFSLCLQPLPVPTYLLCLSSPLLGFPPLVLFPLSPVCVSACSSGISPGSVPDHPLGVRFLCLFRLRSLFRRSLCKGQCQESRRLEDRVGQPS